MGINLFIILVGWRPDLERFNPLPIHHHFHFVDFVETLDHIIAVTCKADLNFVFSVTGERVG